MINRYIPNAQVEKDLEYRLNNIELIENNEIKAERLMNYLSWCAILMGRMPQADKYYERADKLYQEVTRKIIGVK